MRKAHGAVLILALSAPVVHLRLNSAVVFCVLVAAAAGGPAFNVQQTVLSEPGSFAQTGGNKASASLVHQKENTVSATDCQFNSQVQALRGRSTKMQDTAGRGESTAPAEPKSAGAGAWDVWAYNDAMAKKSKGDGSFSVSSGLAHVSSTGIPEVGAWFDLGRRRWGYWKR